MNRSWIVILMGLVTFFGLIIFLFVRKTDTPSSLPVAISTLPTASAVTSTPTTQKSLVEPIKDFKQRITKKFFGTYVTPNNSPVQPEKFTGYHTGVDVEYGDVATDVPVYAVADGNVLLARWASGYGGVIAIQHVINNQKLVGVYGHINPSSLPKVGQKIQAGQQIGILGKGGTNETDGERKHLHFGLVKGISPTLLGYVQNKSQLSAWIDPLPVF
jgi:murein DD-endopeptidase MepM/ murein hydrolase activator NlpD